MIKPWNFGLLVRMLVLEKAIHMIDACEDSNSHVLFFQKIFFEMSVLGSFLLHKEALDAFAFVQDPAQPDEMDLCLLPLIPKPHPIFQSRNCAQGQVGIVFTPMSPHLLTFVPNSGLPPTVQSVSNITFRASQDILNLKLNKEYKVVIADIVDSALGVSQTDQYICFEKNQSTSEEEQYSAGSGDEDEDDVDKILHSIARDAVASGDKGISRDKKRQKRRKLADVTFGDQGVLKPRPAADAAQAWMEKHGGAFVNIDLVPQRGQKGEDSERMQYLRRYQVHDAAKDKMLTIRTLPECLDIVMSKIGRDFWQDMKTQPEVYGLTFGKKDFMPASADSGVGAVGGSGAASSVAGSSTGMAG